MWDTDRAIFPEPARDSFETSLCHDTANPAPVYTPGVKAGASTEVLVVGGGYTGLAAALTLAERGVQATLVDTREPGYGASGRNGGQVVPAFRYDPSEVAAAFGDTLGETVLEMVSRTADVVFDLVARHEIKCDPVKGWVQLGPNASGVRVVEERYRQWKQRGVPVALLQGRALQDAIGTAGYLSGVLFKRAGTVHPLNYARGLAAAALSKGAAVHCNTRVLRLEKAGDRWRAVTRQGEITAKKIILATNGYSTDLWPGLRESVVPLYSMQVATRPLPASIVSGILPQINSAADTRRLVRYFRLDREGRFVMGARGPFKADPSARDARTLIRQARELYPALSDCDFPYRWAGRVAMTRDRIPHLHELAPGVFAGLGYNGRGVGMATMMGKILANACMGADHADLPYPVSPLSTLPFHRFHRLGVQAVATYYRMLDRW